MIDVLASDVVTGVEKRFGSDCSDVGMLARIEDEIALATLSDEPEFSELSKVLRHRRCGGADVFREVVDRVLPVKERPQDAESSFDRNRLQQLHC